MDSHCNLGFSSATQAVWCLLRLSQCTQDGQIDPNVADLIVNQLGQGQESMDPILCNVQRIAVEQTQDKNIRRKSFRNPRARGGAQDDDWRMSPGGSVIPPHCHFLSALSWLIGYFYEYDSCMVSCPISRDRRKGMDYVSFRWKHVYLKSWTESAYNGRWEEGNPRELYGKKVLKRCN